MPDQSNHRLPEEFGGNEWLVDELYEQYLKDKNSVDKKWWSIFDSFKDEEAQGSGNGSAAPSELGANPATRQLPVVHAESAKPKASGESPAASGREGSCRLHFSCEGFQARRGSGSGQGPAEG